MVALISNIENFLDIHEQTTKSAAFFLNLLENNVVELFLSLVSLVVMATQFLTPCL